MTEESYIPKYYFFDTRDHPQDSDIQCGIGLLTPDAECTYFLYKEHMGKSKEHTSEYGSTISFSTQSIVLLFDLVSDINDTSSVQFTTNSYTIDQSNLGPCWICDAPNVEKLYVVQNSGTKNNGVRRICESCIMDSIHVIQQLLKDNSSVIFSHKV